MSFPITIRLTLWKGIVVLQSVPTDRECVLLWSRDECLMPNFCPVEFRVLANHNCNSCAVLCSVPKASSEEFLSKITLFILHG